MAKLLNIPALDGSKFSYHPADKCLSAFESDLRNAPFNGSYPWLNQLWPDACDVGIAIRSHRTGKVEHFYLTDEDTRDGDLLAFHFAPVDKNCPVKKVTIFND